MARSMPTATKGRRVSRPAQGNNATPSPSSKFPKTQPAGGDNVNARGAKRPSRVSNNRRRGYAS